MSNRYRKSSVAERYDCDERTVDRMSRDGRIPPPHYYPGSRIPFWFEEELDEADRRATRVPRGADGNQSARLLSEVSAAPTHSEAIELILDAVFRGELRALNEMQLATLQDLVAEKP
jgi:hypothetical protein